MNKITSAHVFKEILITDFKIFKKIIPDRFINLNIWLISMITVNNYLMPAGLSQSYGSFLIAGLCGSAALFEVWPSIVNLLSDFEGDNITSYYLTLPIPAWLVWLRSIIYYAISSAALAIFVVPLGKLLLQDQFDLTNFSFIKFTVIFILADFFYGAFTLWVTSHVKNMSKIGNIWMRFVYPFWFLGCFQFSWQVSLWHITLFSLS